MFVKMLSVKIEFCPLDWYSSSPTTTVLYNRMYMYVQSVPKQSPKAQNEKIQFT